MPLKREQRTFRLLRRYAIAALALLTILAVVAATIAVVKQQEANRQRQKRYTNVTRRKLGGWCPRPCRCWPVPVPAAECARTNC